MSDMGATTGSQTDIDFRQLLTGRYEAERLPWDFSPERAVPDFAFNVFNSYGLLYRPVVDEHYLASGGAKPVWPDGKPFAVCLTHDVDMVSLHSLRQSKRRRAQNLINGESFLKSAFEPIWLGFDVLRAIRNAKRKDPLHCYERWLDAEERVGARSTFFFWPGWNAVSRYHPSDCPYDMGDRIVFDGQKCTVAEMIREIDRRGWEIGLHPSWYSFDNIDEMKRQKGTLEDVLGHDVVSVRQHYLHFDIRITPRIQAEAGFLYDSTLGFNDNIGFRFGTSYPWKLYDLKAEAELPITEIPLVIQDGALLNPQKGMRLDEDTAFHYVVQVADAVERVGGVLTLLWHPNAIFRDSWWNLCLRSLDHLKSRNAWFGSVRDVARHWQETGARRVED